MLRSLARTFLIVAAAGWFGLQIPSAEAAPISPNNPFRSYNLSGVNYGSQQWEKQHRSKATSPGRRTSSGKIFGRRR